MSTLTMAIPKFTNVFNTMQSKKQQMTTFKLQFMKLITTNGRIAIIDPGKKKNKYKLHPCKFQWKLS